MAYFFLVVVIIVCVVILWCLHHQERILAGRRRSADLIRLGFCFDSWWRRSTKLDIYVLLHVVHINIVRIQ
jgi:hypothetical protein